MPSSSSSSSLVERRGRVVVVVPRPPRFWSSLHPPLLYSNSWCSRALCFGFPGLVALGKSLLLLLFFRRRRKEKKRQRERHTTTTLLLLLLLSRPLLVFSREQRVLSRVVNVSLSFREDETFFSRGKNPKKKTKNPKLPLSSSRGEYFFVCFFLNNNTLFFLDEKRDFDETSLALSRYIYQNSLLRFCSSGLCRDE